MKRMGVKMEMVGPAKLEGRALVDLHPALWRASQLARSITRVVDTGFPPLSAQLPGGGWPTGTQIDLHLSQAGIGELRLIVPALRSVAKRKVLFIGPPHAPQITALAGLGLMPDNILWLRPSSSSDLFWAAEQALRSRSGAVLLWASHARSEAMRRLNLAAQSGEALFFMLRPLAAAQDASPAPLRLSLRPAQGGIEIVFTKRRGPQRDQALVLPLPSAVPVRPSVIPRHPIPTPAPALQPSQAAVDHVSTL